VSLPDEEPKILLTVLNIIHGIFAKVPKNLSLERLYLILALTHKYDMVRKVRPWSASWSSLVTSPATKENRGDARMVFISWELGKEHIFRYLVDSLVILCSVDSEDRLTTPEGHRLDDFDHLGPDDLTGKSSLVSTSIIHVQCIKILVPS
jgi:hypothetical protein